MDAVSTPSTERKREREDASIQESSDAIRMPPPPSKGPRREFKNRNEHLRADIAAEEVPFRSTITLHDVVEIIGESPHSDEGNWVVTLPSLDVQCIVVEHSTNSALHQPFTKEGFCLPALHYLRHEFGLLSDRSQKEYTKLKDVLAATRKAIHEVEELERNAKVLNDNWLAQAKKLKDTETLFFASRKEIHSSHNQLKVSNANGEIDGVLSNMKAHLETSKILSDQYHSGLSIIIQCADAWNTNQQHLKRAESKENEIDLIQLHDLVSKFHAVEKIMVECNTIMQLAYHSVAEVFENVGALYLTFRVQSGPEVVLDASDTSMIRRPIFKFRESILAPLMKTIDSLQQEAQAATTVADELDERISSKKKEIDRYTEKVDVFSKQHESFLGQRSNLEVTIREHESKMKGRASDEAKELQMDHELLSLEISTKFMTLTRANARLTNLKEELVQLTQRHDSNRLEAQRLCKKINEWKARIDENGSLWRKAENDIQLALVEISAVNKAVSS